jgi:3'-phosphoadenosine 5'-phosphosulfate sulfotransferase (PAPS reductase)/FAD synthetase
MIMSGPKLLRSKVVQAKQVIGEAEKRYPPGELAVVWNGDRDSTALLHLIHDALGKIPFPVIFVDSTIEPPEVYEAVDKLIQRWQLNLIKVSFAKKELAKFYRVQSSEERQALLHLMEESAVEEVVGGRGIKALLFARQVGSSDRQRQQEPFPFLGKEGRIRPAASFSDGDISDYLEANKLPFPRPDGKGRLVRRRSSGNLEKRKSPPSPKGRDEERVMRQLRDLGYL